MEGRVLKINIDSIYLKVLIPVLLLSAAALIILSTIIYEKEKRVLQYDNEQILTVKTQKLEGIVYEKIEKWKKYVEVLAEDSEVKTNLGIKNKLWQKKLHLRKKLHL